jgi:hypothetical protein
LRNLLTFLAVALVTALTVALVAPPLIDWSARRVLVARAISVRIGEPVVISGATTLRLLPTPYLSVADVAIGPPGDPWLTARRLRFEIGFASLIGRTIQLDDVLFDHPSLRLGPRFAAPGEGRLSFERIRAEHAEVVIARDGAAPLALHDVSFEGSARSARGPWRGAGDFALGDSRAQYEVATESFDGALLPLKADLDAGATHAHVDGRLDLADAPAFAGMAALSGQSASPDGGVWPWSVEGRLAAQGDAARMDEAAVRLGADARALEAKGRIGLTLSPRLAFDADLAAKTLNVDALLRRGKETSAPPARAAQTFAALVGPALGAQAPAFSLKLRAQAAYLGARLLERPDIAVSGEPGGAMKLKAQSGLPGHARLALDGALDWRPAPIFRGKAQAGAGDFPALAAWAAEGEPELGRSLAGLGAALPQGDITASGDLEWSSQGFALRGVALGAASSRFDGGLVYRRASAAAPGRLFLDLATPSLDIEAAPNVEAGLDWLGDTDLDLRLKADALKVARVGLASVSGGSLSLRARKDGATFTLDKLSLADLGGAAIEAEGEASASRRWARVRLDAARLSDFAALLARVAPGPATGWLLRRADDLGAARIAFEARRDGPPLTGPFALDFLKADGELAGSRFGLTLSRAPAPVDAIAAQASLDSPDGGALLRKLGAKLGAGPAGRAQLSLNATGQWGRGFETKAKLAFAGADAAWSGTLRPQDASLSGPLSLQSADLFPALAALGLAAPGAGVKAPADLAADVLAGAEGAQFSHVKGMLAGAKISGDLAADGAAVTGALQVDRASLGALLSLALGRAAPARPGAVWSEAKFEPALLTPPALDVALKIDALDLGAGIGRSASARLRMGDGRLVLDDASALVNGGKASGRLDLRRSPAQTTASGTLALAGVGFERPGVSGRLDAKLDFVGAGESAASLVGGLAGAGSVSAGEVKVARLDPQALARVYQRIEQAASAPPEAGKLEAMIAAELDKAPLTLTGASGPLALVSGALRFGPLDASGVSGVFNLADFSWSVEARQSYAKVGRFWSGPAPEVTVTAKGEARKVDAALLSAGLASEAIARESDRIENFEADVRERAMFNRARKAWAFLARREEEIDSWRDDQERRALMQLYLGPYTDYAASRREPPPPAPPARNAAGL